MPSWVVKVLPKFRTSSESHSARCVASAATGSGPWGPREASDMSQLMKLIDHERGKTWTQITG